MSAPLGPCPACGGKEDGQGWCIGRRLFIQCSKCDFSCVESHWNILRRKMTREEGARVVGALWEQWNDDDQSAEGVAYDRVLAALTGEKT